jgi:8-oxo-dGTP pyrophosphatase MutT (NUDIX family)
MIQKVLAYITRETERGCEILVLRHPYSKSAPIQIPQGTVEEDEPALSALWREVKEETGLTSLILIDQIAKADYYCNWQQGWQVRNVFHLKTLSETLNAWSHTVTDGLGDKGMVFEFFWLSLAEARETLQDSQSQWLHLITVEKP